MRVTLLIAFASLALQAQDPLLDRAVSRAGGREALVSLTTVRGAFTRMTFQHGAEQWPAAASPFVVSSGTEFIDTSAPRLFIDGKWGTSDTGQKHKRVLTSQGGYSSQGDYRPTFEPAAVPLLIKELLFSPALVLRTVLDSDCTKTSCVSSKAGEFKITFDEPTGHLLSVQWTDNHPLFGRRERSARFGHFRPVRGHSAVLPHLYELSTNGRVSSTVSYSSLEPATKEDTTKIDEAVAEYAAIQARPLKVNVQPIAPNLYYIEAESYASLAVLNGDSVTWIDGPEKRSTADAMLAALREKVPEANVKLFVASHNHLDHLGAVPVFASTGASIITHTANVELFSRMAPSKLIRPIRDKLTIGEVELYAINARDSAAMIIAWLPAHQLLFAADDAEGGNPSSELRAEVSRLGLAVKRIATAHTGVRDWR